MYLKSFMRVGSTCQHRTPPTHAGLARRPLCRQCCSQHPVACAGRGRPSSSVILPMPAEGTSVNALRAALASSVAGSPDPLRWAALGSLRVHHDHRRGAQR
eukprot:639162-Pleurochrysis_carterae.AAC.1